MCSVTPQALASHPVGSHGSFMENFDGKSVQLIETKTIKSPRQGLGVKKKQAILSEKEQGERSKER